MFIGLWIAMFIFINVIPMAYSFYLSLTSYDGLTIPSFVGFENYLNLLRDYRFTGSIVQTIIFTFFNITATLTISLLLANLLSRKIKGQGFFRSVLFLPYAVPIIATVYIWKTLLNRESGLINMILGMINSNLSLNLLVKFPMASLISVFVWQLGGSMIIFLAGFQNIPRELIEAAEIDGASPSSIFRRIKIPLLTPLIMYQIIVGIMMSFSIIVQPILLTSSPGAAFTSFLSQQPPHQNFFTLIYVFQQAFTNQSFGTAMAASWYMLLVMIAISLIFLRLARRFVFYESE
ncbi:MAG: carbohydrate ABC transporter permease [Candidatus Humimicrobiaceae bacterium]